MRPVGAARSRPVRAGLPPKDLCTARRSTVSGRWGTSDHRQARHGLEHDEPFGAVGSAVWPRAPTTLVRVFVLGIDPGLSRCGYGCVEPLSGGRARAVAAGVITTPKESAVPYRLAELQRELHELIAELKPAVVVIERVLFQNNAQTAISVGQASGVAMVESVNAGCTVIEYSPNQVKEAVAGYGAATKDEMERMVQTLLGISRPLRPVDAADAIALALCHLAHVPAVVTGARR